MTRKAPEGDLTAPARPNKVSQTFEKFGNYILLDKLQTGGMAEIYLARKPGASGVSRFVAIKRILPQFSEQTEFIDMFKDEAKIAVQLSHANIVTIYEFGIEKSQFFLAMDYVEGRNLRQILNKMKKSGVSFSIEQVLYIIKEVAAGLDHAHRCIDSNTGKPLNIIHRDMSPQNVMVSFEGEVKIVDFGIAKAETQLDTTRAGTLKGKFGYMSPEQAEGQNVDLRTDIFALGIVLWELLANDRLFVANNEVNTLRKVRDCQIPSLRKINPNIPPELERIVSKALAKDRNLRYQTAAALNRELSRFLNRQFPDFSPHDFSVFIKTLFAAEILDSRKKMVEYSKTQIPDFEPLTLPPPPRNSRSQSNAGEGNESAFNDSGTFTENTVGPADIGEPEARPVAPPAKRTHKSANNNLGNGSGQRPPAPPPVLAAPAIRTSTLSVDRSSYREREHSNHENSKSSSNGTYYGTRSFSDPSIRTSGWSFSSVVPIMLILIAIGGGAASVYYPKEVKTLVARFMGGAVALPGETPGKEIGKTTSASTAEVDLVVISTPSGAEIFINGDPVGEVTPATLRQPKDKDIKISVRLAGHASFEQTIKLDTAKSLNVTLVAEKTGKLDIVVVGTGQILIDGKLVAPGGPVTGLSVQANRQIVVRAEDPSTKASDQQTIMVAENTTKKVVLYPRAFQRQPQSPNQKR